VRMRLLVEIRNINRYTQRPDTQSFKVGKPGNCLHSKIENERTLTIITKGINLK